MKYKVRNFRPGEFDCKCGYEDCVRSNVAVALVYWLDVLRMCLGKPIKVNSGYRCVAHNTAVGGSPMSRHIVGCAADIQIPGYFDGYGKVMEAFQAMVAGRDWEFKVYPTFLHVAVPRVMGSELWGGKEINVTVNDVMVIGYV